MRRTTTIVVTVFAMVLFSLPLVMFLGGVRSNPEFENRALSKTPALSLASILDTNMYREITAYYIDRVPLREQAVTADAWIDFYIVGETPNSAEVVVGDVGWLYNPHNFDETCTEDLPVVEQVVENADLLMAVLAGSGRRVAFTVIPQKRTIVPEHLGDLTIRAACAENNAARLWAALLADPPPGYVDTWGVLMERASAGEDVYFRDDTHWSYLGAARGAEAIIEQIMPGLWSDDDLVFGETRERVGNLVRQMGLEFEESYVSMVVERNGVEIESSRVALTNGTPVVLVYETQIVGDAVVIPGKTVVLGDSFMWFTAEEHLAPYSETLLSMSWRSLRSEGPADDFEVEPIVEGEEWLLEQLAEAETIVVQTVEFRAWHRFNTPRLAYLSMNALSADLVHEDVDPSGARITVLPDGLASRHVGRPFLIVRAGVVDDLDVRVFHRESPDGDWGDFHRGVSLHDGVAVIDLQVFPSSGELGIRVNDVDPSLIDMIRVVWV